ncbi:hypothetical protein Tco_0906153, partial [Tanacetum coccineum]
LTESISQKTYAYGDVRSKNQDLLMVISSLKDKLNTFEKGKGMNTKFDKSVTSGKLLCVTPLPSNIAVQAKKVSNPEDKTDRSKPVTSHSTPKNKQNQKKNANVIAREMYKIPTQESHTQVSKTNMNVSNYTGVRSSNSFRRPKSKDTKSRNRFLKNTNDKSSSAHVRKMSSSVRIDSNKREIINSTVCQLNACVLNTKTVNAVNDGSNIVCVSCGKDVFMLSHEKCVARYALSIDSRVKRALFTTPIAAKSKNLGATSVVAKSRLSVAKTPTSTNKVSSALSLSLDSSQSRTLSNYMKNKIATSQKWQKWFEYQPCFNWSPKSKTAQSPPSVSKSSTSVRTKSKTLVIIQKLVAKLSTLPSTKLWLWHRRLSHLNFAYEQGKSKKASFPPKMVPSTESKLELLHMDLCTTRLLMRKPNVQYFHVFRSLCYPINDRDDLGKMKPKADIGIFIGYSESSRAMASEYLDNLFGPLCEEYYATSAPEVSVNSAANTLDNEDTPSSSSIIVEEDEAPQIISSSEELVDTEPNTPVLNENVDELLQEDVAELDKNVVYNPLHTPVFEEAESSSTYQDPSNMHEFHQTHRSTDKWTKNHPIEQVIGDPSKPVMTRHRLHTNAEMCMYALTVSTTEPKNIKEAMLDHNWIESMQDKLNQFKRLAELMSWI